jgi:hypothetical protein
MKNYFFFAITFFFMLNLSVFADKTEGDVFIGQKICREAPGPEDTTGFEIVLQKDGLINGSGSYSGASAYFVLSSGSWKSAGSFIEIILNYSGKNYASDNLLSKTHTVKIKILKSDLLSNKSDCFEYQGAIQ